MNKKNMIHCKVIIKNSKTVQHTIDDLIVQKQKTCMYSNYDVKQMQLIVNLEKLDKNMPKLRKRKLQNYAEISVVENQDEGILHKKEHLPIYRQIHEENTKNDTSDLYEFHSDSERTKSKKSPKARSSADTSIGFERNMKEVMQNIERNFRKNASKKTNRKPRIKIKKNIQKKAIKSGISNAVSNTLPQAGAHATVVHKVTNNQLLNNEFVLNAASFDIGPVTLFNIKNANGKSDDFCRFESHEDVRNSSQKLSIENSDEPNIIKSVNTKFHSDIQETNEESISDESDFFGFLNVESEISDSESRPIEMGINNDRINIVSNVLLVPSFTQKANVNNSLLDVTYDNFHRPNANSTMLIKNKVPQTSSPWRPNLTIMRNPHLLQIKETLLPNYNQEMIIDSSLIEKSFTNTDLSEKTNKKIQQTSMLDYIVSSKVNNVVALQDRSLFDDSDFSPIKLLSASIQKDTDKENLKSSPMKKMRQIILGPVIDSTVTSKMLISSPLQNLTNHDLQLRVGSKNVDDLENYFGFDSLSDDKENLEVSRRNPAVVRNLYFKKPVRCDNLIKPVIKEKVVANEDQHATADLNTRATSNGLVLPEVQNVSDVKLFEDLEPVSSKPIVRSYPHKKIKRRRPLSVESDDSENEFDRPKHKKKHARTQQEEEEVERWAAAFNSMCEEIDKYTLEIE